MRRHDLDWLRVLVFALLIFYHVGMLFVPWGFHIKNNSIYEWLFYPMWFLNQWRLPILFVISGMGTYYALQKRTAVQFSLERIKRLLLPLVFGMLFIVSPQVYVERLVNKEFAGGYFDFWPNIALDGIYPEGNLSWHHLWFLPYLLIFSLLLIPIFMYLKKHSNSKFIKGINTIVKSPVKIYLFIIPLYLFETLLEPYFSITHALIDDWFNFINCMTLFLYGFLLITVRKTFWQTVKKFRMSFLITGIISFSVMLILVKSTEDSTLRHFTEGGLKVINLWSWILALFGFAAKYLNKKSKVLRYANEAVYPYYILHQTVMMVLAYFLIDKDLSFWIKAPVLVFGTFGISGVIYEVLIRRWRFVRPFFGLKVKQQ